jgi:hypothetical protein
LHVEWYYVVIPKAYRNFHSDVDRMHFVNECHFVKKHPGHETLYVFEGISFGDSAATENVKKIATRYYCGYGVWYCKGFDFSSQRKAHLCQVQGPTI